MSEQDQVPEDQDVEGVEAQEQTANEGAGKDELETLQQALADAEQKASDNWEKFMRASAETDNLRRRMVKDVEHAHKFALEKFVADLVPVRDSLEMGISAAEEESSNVQTIIEGTELTLKMFVSTLEKYGVKEIDPKGQPFDPEFHEAVTMLPSEEFAANTVVDVMQKGYALNDRLVRPAMVVVSKG